MRRRAQLSAIVLALMAAACSSTAPRSPSLSAVDRVQPATTLRGSTAESTDGAQPGSSPNPRASARRANPRSARDATTTATVGDKTLTLGKGATAAGISIGIPWIDASQAQTVAQAAFGASVAFADSRAQAQAVVDHLNDTGGIAGLKVLPVYHQIDVASSTTLSGRDREAQAACARWTEDAEVFAFLVVIGPNDNYATCAQQTRSVILTSGFGQPADETEFARLRDLLYYPSGMLADTREKLVVDQMVAAKVLSPKVKVGMVVDGTSPLFPRASARSAKPALQRHGIPVASTVVIPDCIQAPWDTYTLNFRQAGVTHLHFGATNCGVSPLLFMARAADNQQWYPHYVLGSDQVVNGVAAALPRQGENFRGVGWTPTYDVGEVTSTSTDKLCEKIMAEAGQPQYDPLNTGPSYCETLLFLQAALRNTDAVTVEALAARSRALGTNWEPVVTHGADFGFPMAANTVQLFAFDAECSCMQYTTRPARFR